MRNASRLWPLLLAQPTLGACSPDAGPGGGHVDDAGGPDAGGGGVTTLSRASFEAVGGVALAAFVLGEGAPGALEARDLVVRDGRSALTRRGGYGVLASDGQRVVLERAALTGLRATGIWVQGWGRAPETSLVATDLRIEAVGSEECAGIPPDRPWTCQYADGSHSGGGIGLHVSEGGKARLDLFRVAGCATAGITLAAASVLRADGGVVTGNPIGINHLGDAGELADRLGDVYVFGNGVDFASEELAVPDPSTFIAR